MKRTTTCLICKKEWNISSVKNGVCNLCKEDAEIKKDLKIVSKEEKSPKRIKPAEYNHNELNMSGQIANSAMKKTKDYSQFKYLPGNRDLVLNHVDRLVKSISKNNLLKNNPIMINKQGYILDGQHRLQAAEELGVDIYYNVLDGGLSHPR